MPKGINEIRGVNFTGSSAPAGISPNVGAASARASGGGCCGDSAPCCETQDAVCCSSDSDTPSTATASTSSPSGAVPGSPGDGGLWELLQQVQALVTGKGSEKA